MSPVLQAQLDTAAEAREQGAGGRFGLATRDNVEGFDVTSYTIGKRGHVLTLALPTQEPQP